jgi:hypothetical protein
MKKHTTAPWTYDTTGDYADVVRHNGVVIARIVRQITHADGEPEANANLISAAPELFDAAQLLIDLDNAGCVDASKLPPVYKLGIVMEIAKARAALAKARGGLSA